MPRLALPSALCLLAMPALGQGFSDPPLTPSECDFLDPMLSRTIAAVQADVESAPRTIVSMHNLRGGAEGRPEVQAEIRLVIAALEQVMASNRELARALDDLRHQIRLCAREAR